MFFSPQIISFSYQNLDNIVYPLLKNTIPANFHFFLAALDTDINVFVKRQAVCEKHIKVVVFIYKLTKKIFCRGRIRKENK